MMRVVVNTTANGGRGYERWQRVQEELERTGCAFQVVETRSLDEAKSALDDFLKSSDSVIVGAGGDGTINGILNHLCDARVDLDRVHLGAIGIGSSNDFHKPLEDRRQLAKIPVRIDSEKSRAIDIGRALLTRPDGQVLTRHFALNGCVGLVASGNDFFNRGDRALHFLKRRSVGLAIAYSALVSLYRHRPIEISLSIDGGAPVTREVSNLHFLKKPQFAGDMRYDTPVTPDDGHFDVCVWDPMSRLRALSTVLALQRGRFTGRKGAEVRRARSLEIRSETPIAIELDGEIETVQRAQIEVIPRAIQVCS